MVIIHSFARKNLKAKKTTDNIGLRFVITQHSKDSVLFDNISNYLGCGKCYFNRLVDEVYLIVSTFSDINNKIISLFNKYPLLGTKKEDYRRSSPSRLRRIFFSSNFEYSKLRRKKINGAARQPPTAARLEG